MNFIDLDKKLQAEFAQKRIKAEWIATQNKKRAKSTEAYSQIEKIEKDLIFDFAKAKANGKQTSELASALKLARAKKKEILKALKLSESDLEPKYSCKKCSDSGFIGGTMCSCYQKRRNEELVKECGLDINSSATFEKFDTKICKNEKHAETLEKLKNKLVEWSEKYPNVKKNNILLSGTPGGGKTFLTQCLANEMIKKGYSVCFVSAYEMNNMFLKYHTTFNNHKYSYIAPLIESDFLFVDDLGTEPIMKNVTLNNLFVVLSERERFARPMIVSTNLLPEHILDRYGERIYSRLNNKLSSLVFFLEGDDLRTTK